MGIDADTLQIRAIEVTGSPVGGARKLPELLDQMPSVWPLADSEQMVPMTPVAAHAAIAARSSCADIPARKNARPWREIIPGAQARNATVRATRRLDRTIWRRWSGYHRRRVVVTKMRCFKPLGERFTARDFDRQVAEPQITAAILKRFTALGTPKTQRVE